MLSTRISTLAEKHVYSYPRQYLSQGGALLKSHSWEATVVGQPLVANADFVNRWQQGSLTDWEVQDPDCSADIKRMAVTAKGYFKVTKTVMGILKLMQDALQEGCNSGAGLH